MHTTYRVNRSNKWFEVRGHGDRECFYVPDAVKRCAEFWRCSRVFYNGVRAEPELGTPCGRLNGAPYVRTPAPHKDADAAAVALALALVLLDK